MPSNEPSSVSSHITITTDARLGGRTLAALSAIDSVHTDGELRPAQIVGFKGIPGECGRYSPRTREIGLNIARDDHEQTVAHEVGHLVAIEGIGAGSPVCANSSALAEWRDAVLASATHKRLVRMRKEGRVRIPLASSGIDYALDADDLEQVEYLLMWEELWARTYCQFIAVRAHNNRMLRQIATESSSNYGLIFSPNWPDNDFLPIENAIESVMKNRGWM